MNADSDKIVDEIKRRALLFVIDNPRLFHLQTQIEAAMMVGASIVLETQATEDCLHPGVFRGTKCHRCHATA